MTPLLALYIARLFSPKTWNVMQIAGFASQLSTMTSKHFWNNLFLIFSKRTYNN